MQRLVTGKTRFPDFNDEWKIVKLEEVMEINRLKGKSVELNENQQGIPYIGSTSFSGNFNSYTTDQDAILVEKVIF